MTLALGGPIAVSLVLSLSLATLSGKQGPTSRTSSSTGAAQFPVEETTIAQLHTAYLAGKATSPMPICRLRPAGRPCHIPRFVPALNPSSREPGV
jgi:hypothetical protein